MMSSNLIVQKNDLFPQAIPLGSIEAYIRHVNNINILTVEEEQALVKK